MYREYDTIATFNFFQTNIFSPLGVISNFWLFCIIFEINLHDLSSNLMFFSNFLYLISLMYHIIALFSLFGNYFSNSSYVIWIKWFKSITNYYKKHFTYFVTDQLFVTHKLLPNQYYWLYKCHLVTNIVTSSSQIWWNH